MRTLGPPHSLAGYRVVLLREREQGAESAALFAEHGADVVLLPTIETHALGNAKREALLDAARRVAEYDWLVFTSANAVRFFADALHETTAAAINANTACVGPETGRALQRYLQISPTLTASKHVGEGLIEAFHEALAQQSTPLRILIPRALVARDQVPDALRALGHTVDVVPAYETAPASDIGARWHALKKARDVLVFSSPSTVRALLGAVGTDALKGAIIASIGPETTRALGTAGVQVDVVATEHSLRGVCEALLTGGVGLR
jgi:uroporphyrinogen III methyltransferase / synthase